MERKSSNNIRNREKGIMTGGKRGKGTAQMDMLHGSLMNKILIFAIPLAASSILQQLFNSVDVAVVGRFAGSQALAAVGGNSSVINLLINFFVGLSMGANIVIANYIGQQKSKEIHDVVHTVILLAFFSGLFLLVLGVLAAKPILIWIHTPSDILELATLYLRIYFLGIPFVMIYNYGAAILRSKGDTKRPLYCLTLSGAINVVLNLLLVIVFHLGVAGVGIATVISNGVSAGIILYILMHEDRAIRLNIHDLSIKKDHLIRIIKIGAPAGIQGVVFPLSNVCIQAAINGFGSNAVAGSAAALNFEYYIYFIVNAFSQAAVTFTSQNYGALQYKRCKKIFRLTMISSTVITGLVSVGFVAGRNYFIPFFTVDPNVVDYVAVRMIHVSLFESMIGLYEIPGAALRGMGRSMLPTVIIIIGSCGFRIAWVYTIFPHFRSYSALLNVYPASWILTTIGMLVAYYLIQRKALTAASS